jgi:hypothetical protein
LLRSHSENDNDANFMLYLRDAPISTTAAAAAAAKKATQVQVQSDS